MINEADSNRGSFGRRLLFPLMAVTLSLMSMALLLEVGLRLAGYSPGNVNYLSSFHQFDEIAGHRGKKNFEGRFKRPEFDVSIAHNADGFRRQEFLKSEKQQSCGQTIHVFGDSFTWGWGVGQGEVFSDLMNRELNGVCVRNYGIISTGTVAQYELLTKEVKSTVRPGDVVMLMFFSNDFDDNAWKGKLHAELQNGVISIINEEKPFNSIKDKLERISYLFNYLSYKVNLYQLSRTIKRNQSDQVKLGAFEATDKRYMLTRHFLELFRDECKAMGARFIVAYIPSQAEMGEGSPAKPNLLENEKRFRTAFFNIGSSLKLEMLDMLPILLEYKKKNGNKRLTFDVDEHWNVSGHKAAAMLIEQYLQESK